MGFSTASLTGLDNNDLAEVVDTLPDDISDVIRQSLDYQGLRDLEATLAFPEKSAGRLMETELVAIRFDVTLETVLRFLRQKEKLPEHTSGLMVIDRGGTLMGELPFAELLTINPSIYVFDVIKTDNLSVSPKMKENELSALFREHDLVSVPVDNDNKIDRTCNLRRYDRCYSRGGRTSNFRICWFRQRRGFIFSYFSQC